MQNSDDLINPCAASVIRSLLQYPKSPIKSDPTNRSGSYWQEPFPNDRKTLAIKDCCSAPWYLCYRDQFYSHLLKYLEKTVWTIQVHEESSINGTYCILFEPSS